MPFCVKNWLRCVAYLVLVVWMLQPILSLATPNPDDKKNLIQAEETSEESIFSSKNDFEGSDILPFCLHFAPGIVPQFAHFLIPFHYKKTTVKEARTMGITPHLPLYLLYLQLKLEAN